MGLGKARIIYEQEVADDKKETTANTDQKTKTEEKRIDVMFNPSSLKIRSATRYSDPKEINAKKDPEEFKKLQQFLRVENDILTVELFFDTTRKDSKVRDVRTVVKPILDLAKPGKGNSLPPTMKFAWGDFIFPCVISSIDQTYDYFDSAGHALRATLAMTLLGYDPKWEPEKEKPAGDDDKTKNATTVKDGEKLPEVAARTTGDPEEWKPVAKSANIVNPLDDNETTGAKVAYG